MKTGQFAKLFVLEITFATLLAFWNTEASTIMLFVTALSVIAYLTYKLIDEKERNAGLRKALVKTANENIDPKSEATTRILKDLGFVKYSTKRNGNNFNGELQTGFPINIKLN